MSRVDALIGSSALKIFGPLLYVAWADGELTDDEVTSVRDLTKGFALSGDEHGVLESWLDPTAPPDAHELSLLRARLADDDVSAAEGHEAEVEQMGAILCWNPVMTESVVPEGAVDTERLSRFLDGPEREVRLAMRNLVTGEGFVRRFGQSKEVYRERVLEWTQKVADAGFGHATFEDGRGSARFMAAFETAGHFDLNLSVKMGVHFGLFGGAIHNLGTAEHRKLTGDVATLKLPGCFAMTERGHGSNVRDLETTATYDPEREVFVIHTPTASAHKDYIGNAACHAKMAAVFAQLITDGVSYGVHCFLVPIRDDDGNVSAGVRIEDCGDKMGLQGVDNGRIWFDHVEVPRAALLNRFGDVDKSGKYTSSIASDGRRFFTMLGTLVAGRVSVANVAIAAAKSGLATAVGYANQRKQFTRPAAPGEEEEEVTLMTYPTHQMRLIPLLADTYAAHFAGRLIIEKFLERDEDNARELESLAAGIKVYATELCTRTLQQAREACGGQGYLAANLIGAWKNDSDVFTTFEGDNTVLLQLVAKGLLTEFKQQFSDDRVFGFVRYLAKRASRRWTTTNPWVSRDESSEHLRDHTFHRDALRFRETRLLSSVAMRLKNRVDDGQSSYDAFLACQLHLVRAARAHIERVVLDESRLAIKEADDSLRPHLDALLDLYALNCIERDLGWFCKKDVLATDKASALEREREGLCAQLAPHARDLCDAFGIPPGLLPPIARADTTVLLS